MNHSQAPMQHQQHDMDTKPYINLLIMTLLTFVAMYFLMYSMVNDASNVIMNVNNVYMAGVMAMPMIPIMLVIMRSMYRNRKLNIIFHVGSILALLLMFFAIRQQAAVGNQEFVRSMIPHHAGAILMCNQASISDPEIKDLCGSIIKSQQSEIDQMKQIIQRLEK